MTSALSLQWSFGFDADVLDGVLSLCDGRRQAIFYPAAQTGVVYDYSTRRGGARNTICIAFSPFFVVRTDSVAVRRDDGLVEKYARARVRACRFRVTP